MFKSTLAATAALGMVLAAAATAQADTKFVWRSAKTGVINVAAASTPPVAEAKSYFEINMNGGWKYQCETDLTASMVGAGTRFKNDFEPGGFVYYAFNDFWVGNTASMDWSDFNPSNVFGLPDHALDYAGDFETMLLNQQYVELLPWPKTLCNTPFTLVTAGSVGSGDGVGYASGGVVTR